MLVVAVAAGSWIEANAFAVVDGQLRGIVGSILMAGATWALWYHMLGRLRHVIWDLGYLVEVDISEKMGLAMFIGATALTILTLIAV